MTRIYLLQINVEPGEIGDHTIEKMIQSAVEEKMEMHNIPYSSVYTKCAGAHQPSYKNPAVARPIET